mgnify:CR=1 FL=1|jgi:hypothetical protein
MPNPRGRPPMSCDKLDEKILARKTQKGKNTLLKKCSDRNEHATKPCKVNNGKCVMNTKSSDKIMQKCKDANIARGSLSKGEQRKQITKRCNTLSINTGLSCKVTQKTGKCGNNLLIKKKNINT